MQHTRQLARIQTARAAPPFSNDAERWEAVVRRNRAADGAFYYSVRTTGVLQLPYTGLSIRRDEA